MAGSEKDKDSINPSGSEERKIYPITWDMIVRAEENSAKGLRAKIEEAKRQLRESSNSDEQSCSPDDVEKPREEKMLWEITDEIIDRADRKLIDNWDRNLAEARERLGITEIPDEPPKELEDQEQPPQPHHTELSDEQVKEILSDLSPGEQRLVDHWRAEGKPDREIAEMFYYF